MYSMIIRPLHELIIKAIRYGDRPEFRNRLFRVVNQALDRDTCKLSWNNVPSLAR